MNKPVIRWSPQARAATETKAEQKARMQHALHIQREKDGMIAGALSRRRGTWSGLGWYGGTVPAAVIARRRKQGKAAKAARKLHRSNR